MRPVAEGEEAEEKDLTQLRRMLKRAKLNGTRSKASKREVVDLYQRLIMIFTREQCLPKNGVEHERE